MNEPHIISFKDQYASNFKDLNVAWLTRYFYVEPKDVKMLSNPRGNIIEKGGAIYFALVGNEVAGTVALLKMSKQEYELGKMAVDEKLQGKGLAHLLIKHCLEEAKRMGAAKVILYSNTILLPAIHLYQKFGFTEVPIGKSEYKRSNIKMEKIIA